jgi:hypothetical protein
MKKTTTNGDALFVSIGYGAHVGKQTILSFSICMYLTPSWIVVGALKSETNGFKYCVRARVHVRFLLVRIIDDTEQHVVVVVVVVVLLGNSGRESYYYYYYYYPDYKKPRFTTRKITPVAISCIDFMLDEIFIILVHYHKTTSCGG